MSRSILIADSSLFMRFSMRRILGQLDMEVVAEAGRGDEVVSLYQETRPDLAFIDLSLPGKDGVSVAREILAGDPTATVVLLSAMGKASQAQAAHEWGVAGVLVKPFHSEMVQKVAIRALSSKAAP